ncbi:MAG TPA: preQ(1) synthase [Verrucomicrobiales bacterium]|nr:preQ(1) synthase [Verrucomicrobiales bacterium]
MENESDGARSFRLLGGSGSGLPPNPDEAILETFPNRHPARDYWIDLDCPEFTSLCPVTGQPDHARLTIRYVPDTRCVETKSLKFYLASFRNHRAFNEEVVNRIADDLLRTCAPRKLEVHGEFAPRGGIRLTVRVKHPAEDSGD